MKLAVSNIAWTNEEESAIAKLLQKLGITYVEIAPTKLWEEPSKVSDKQIEDYKKFWAKYGIEIVAFQSILFSRPDLKMFESDGNRSATLTYLKDFIVLAGKLGASRLVFGSPKNRQRGDIPFEQANNIAREFFNELGNEAKANNVCFCIEPNAPQYGCDFITTAQAGIELVRAVSNPGFGLHLDTGCMSLVGDDIAQSIQKASELLQHFHISSPMLEPVEARADVNHQAAAKALHDIDYNKFGSIEMKPGKPGKNLDRVEKAVRFAQAIYDN